jgi:hypothetical protein
MGFSGVYFVHCEFGRITTGYSGGNGRGYSVLETRLHQDDARMTKSDFTSVLFCKKNAGFVVPDMSIENENDPLSITAGIVEHFQAVNCCE